MEEIDADLVEEIADVVELAIVDEQNGRCV
jgi:hypothetical protein